MMADNVHRKSHKTSDGRKLSMPINRTTSETIRIATNNGENDNKNSSSGQSGLSQNCLTSIGNSTSTPNNNQCKKKTSSFQITSVTVGNRLSNDAGEDSNDDLDESHGEDNSIEHSRIENDIETPSYSEDTFSKDDVFFNASNSGLSTAPVIPTSSQYGLAIVPSDASGNVSNSSNDSNINSLDITNVNENNIINLLSSNNKQDNDDTTRDCVTQTRNERFKVVKIESTEPFKRGRWTCMDYLDHTSVNNQANIKIDPNQVCISYGVSDGVMLPNVNDDKLMDLNGHVTNQNYPGNSIQQNCQRNLGTGIQQLQPIYFHSTAQQQLQQQGSTLPSNLQPMHSNNLGQAQSMPQGSIPIITHTNNNNLGANIQEDYVNLATQGGICQNLCQGVNNPPIIIQNQGLQVGQQGQINQINDNLSGIQRIQGIQSLHQVQGGIHGVNQSTLSNNCVIGGTGGGNVGAGVNAQVQIVPQVGGCQGIGGMGFHQEGTEQDSVTGAAADAALLECLAEVTQTNDDHQQLGDNESMSGTSAVAIDNKIEQAMDLVKSHLMFAVREEVEVLKEKIAELMDRINQLEAENSILKAHATPEILAQLNQVINKLPQNNLASGQ